MSAMTTSETEEMIEVVSSKVHLRKGGSGEALVILHDDVGSPGWLPFYEELSPFDLNTPVRSAHTPAEEITPAKAC